MVYQRCTKVEQNSQSLKELEHELAEPILVLQVYKQYHI